MGNVNNLTYTCTGISVYYRVGLYFKEFSLVGQLSARALRAKSGSLFMMTKLRTLRGKFSAKIRLGGLGERHELPSGVWGFTPAAK